MSDVPRASELRAHVAALEAIETDLTALEGAAKDHERKDMDRFLQLGQGMATLEHELEFIRNHLTILQDSMIEGFRKLGAQIEKRDPNEVTPPRRGRNGL